MEKSKPAGMIQQDFRACTGSASQGFFARTDKPYFWGTSTAYDKRRWLMKGLNLVAIVALLAHWSKGKSNNEYEIIPDLLYHFLQLVLTENTWLSAKFLAMTLNAHQCWGNLEKMLFWQERSISTMALSLDSIIHLSNMADALELCLGPSKTK